jgi:hypothetical protein
LNLHESTPHPIAAFCSAPMDTARKKQLRAGIFAERVKAEAR